MTEDKLITELLEKVNAIFNSGALDKLLKLNGRRI